MRLGAGRRREPVTVDVASNVELHCPVYGIEDPRVGWFKQRERNLVRVRPGTCCRGVTIRNVTTENRITLILSIRNLSANHYGRYVCRTNNRAGQDEGRVVLNGKCVCRNCLTTCIDHCLSLQNRVIGMQEIGQG